MKSSPRISVLIVSSEESPLDLSPRLQERYRVNRVSNGAVALETLQANHFDVLLISAQLSDMSGTELAAQLAKQEDKPISILVHEHVVALNHALATLDLPTGIEHLNRPIGEFTLMKAIDDAGTRAGD